LYVLGVLVSTIIAEITIGPIALYHFGRFALYGLPSNMLAVPIMGFLVMPLGLLALVLTPLGLDAFVWQAMAFFMSMILDVAALAASLPHADFMIPKIPHTALVLVLFGGLWLCLWQTFQIRKWFFISVVLGLFVYAAHDLPDVIVDREGRLITISDTSGRYYFNSLRTASFSRENWQRTLGAEEIYGFADYPNTDREQLMCDDLGCLLNRGTKIAFSYQPAAFAEDCQRADIIITTHYAPFPCKDEKLVIDRTALRKNGAHAIWLGEKISIRSSGQGRGHRPWTNSDQ
jgi:competence protein ComEC